MVVRSRECTLEGSDGPLIKLINAAFEFTVVATMTWADAEAPRRIDCDVALDVDVSRGVKKDAERDAPEMPRMRRLLKFR